MATNVELKNEYEMLKAMHDKLLEERTALRDPLADGPAFQDYGFRTRQYMAALESYQTALKTRREEVKKMKNRGVPVRKTL